MEPLKTDWHDGDVLHAWHVNEISGSVNYVRDWLNSYTGGGPGGGGSSSVTVVVASQDSSAEAKAAANYVCDGTDDHVEINEAVASLPSTGGKVMLLEGVYSCPGEILVDSESVWIEGQGAGYATIIGVPDIEISRRAAIIAGVTRKVRHFGIRNLWINVSGWTGQTKAGTGHGVVITGDASVVENVTVQFCSGNSFHYGQDLLQPELITAIASASDGYAVGYNPYPGYDTITVADTSGFRDGGLIMVRKPDGRVAFAPYLSKTSTTFVDCQFNWRGEDDFVLEAGDEVFQTEYTYETTAINAHAQFHGGDGFYVDWHNSSSEWVLCRTMGQQIKPTEVGDQCGFYVQGSLCKFLLCHPYWETGWGLQVGDKWSFTTAGNWVTGGEYETCARGGILVRNNSGPVDVSDVNFYDNGVAQFGSGWFGTDMDISYNARDVKISNCVFFDGPLNNRQGKNIYLTGCERVTIEGNFFRGQSWPDLAIENIYVNGNDEFYPAKKVAIRNNRFYNANSGSFAVKITGYSTDCVVESNISDASMVELAFGDGVPNRNVFRNNTLYTPVGNPDPYITILGVDSRVEGVVAPPVSSSSPGWRGQTAYDDDYSYVCVDTDTWKRSALSSF